MSLEEELNRRAWDRLVQDGDIFTIPAPHEMISAARRGEWQIFLTPTRPAPRDWFEDLNGKDILCLGAGGGRHSPILAAAGANVTVLDISPKQLEQDRIIAERERFEINIVLGSMTDLSMFSDESFDLILNPVSNLFIRNVWPVWVESYRLLRPGGALTSGFMNPTFYIFDRKLMDEEDKLVVRHSIPYSELASLNPPELREMADNGWPIEFGHSLEDQIGAQISVGFIITGFYEDRDPRTILSEYLPIYIVTRATKPQST